MFKFKREIGVPEIISLVAVIVSILAYWNSVQSNKGFIIKAGGAGSYVLVKNKEKCSFVSSLPVVFHNSGKQAVSLKQFLPNPPAKTLIFISKGKFLTKEEVGAKIYLSYSNIHPLKSMWLNKVQSSTEFEPSYSVIEDLIKPNEQYSFYIITVIDSYGTVKKHKNLNSIISFKASFSNDQEIEVGNYLEIDSNLSNECSKY